MEYKDMIDIDDLILHTSVDHNLNVSEHGLFFYSLKSKLPVIMTEKQLKQELQKLKDLQSGLQEKINWVERNLNLFQNDKSTAENEISQTPSITEEEHSSEVDQSPKSPQKPSLTEVKREIKEELRQDLYLVHDNVDQNENLYMVHDNGDQIEMLTENHESREGTNLEEENCFDEVYEPAFITNKKSGQECSETTPTGPTELQKEATKSYLSKVAQSLEKGEVSYIFVKKPKIEAEKGYFSNENKLKMVEFLKTTFKRGNIIQISTIRKENIVVAYAKDSWKMQVMEDFEKREFQWPHNGEKVLIIDMKLASEEKWIKFSEILNKKIASPRNLKISPWEGKAFLPRANFWRFFQPLG
jgi:hypothetical protein